MEAGGGRWRGGAAAGGGVLPREIACAQGQAGGSGARSDAPARCQPRERSRAGHGVALTLPLRRAGGGGGTGQQCTAVHGSTWCGMGRNSGGAGAAAGRDGGCGRPAGGSGAKGAVAPAGRRPQTAPGGQARRLSGR